MAVLYAMLTSRLSQSTQIHLTKRHLAATIYYWHLFITGSTKGVGDCADSQPALKPSYRYRSVAVPREAISQ